MFHNWMGGGMWFSWIFWVIIIVLVVWMIVNRSNKNRLNFPQHENALDILRKRYAKGEITKEQFEQMKKDLE